MLTSKPDIIYRSVDGVAYCAVPLDWFDAITALVARFERENPEPESMTDVLRRAADFNRDHAAEKFSDALHFDALESRWLTRDDNSPVVFTPHGWRKESEI